MEKDDVVRLATATNPLEAHVWQRALADEGIRAEVVGDYLDAGLGDVPGFRAELWVHRDDVARAEAVLRAHHKEHPPGEEEAEEA
jgi:hypothetical protein